MKRLVNAITCTRFVFALILVLAAPGSAWFWAAYGLGAVSDVLDGLLARRFGVQSDGGARLDSAADIAFLLALTAALLRARQLVCWLLYAAGAVLLIRSVTYAAGFYKFRTFVSLYTILNRAAGERQASCWLAIWCLRRCWGRERPRGLRRPPPGFPHWKSWCWCCAPGRRPPMCAACYG